LTGGIASGKSTVATILHDFGAAVLDADGIVADLYAPGNAGASAVEKLFGKEFVTREGAADKAKIAREVFRDPAARKRLEAAIHPLVVARIRRHFADAEKAGASLAVAEASQIFEEGYEKEFDRVIAVVAPESVRLARRAERGISREETLRRIEAQISEAAARQKADDVIENAGTIEDLRAKVAALYEKLSVS
jgi:dephospho-CoA kinase